MFDTLSDNQKKALARVGLGIMGISYVVELEPMSPIYMLYSLISFTLIRKKKLYPSYKILLGWIKAKQPKSRNS